MLLCCYMFRPYKAIFRQHLYRDTNSLYANRIIFLRNVVDAPSFSFEFRLFLCHIGCVVFIVPIKHCVAFLVYNSYYNGENIIIANKEQSTYKTLLSTQPSPRTAQILGVLKKKIKLFQTLSMFSGHLGEACL
jgi:hypothetical protein